MLSAVSANGQFQFMTVEGSINATVFREFLKRLIVGVDRKLFLIVDGHPAHKAKLVRRFVADCSDYIELFFLPPYSPELNPDELVWGNVKTRIAKMGVKETKGDLKAVVHGALRRLLKMPQTRLQLLSNAIVPLRLCVSHEALFMTALVYRSQPRDYRCRPRRPHWIVTPPVWQYLLLLPTRSTNRPISTGARS